MPRKIIFFAFALLVILVSVIFFDDEKNLINDAARKGTKGNYIRLPDGITHYEIAGNSNADVVVLIHGGSVPYFIWDRTFPDLKEKGFRVLRYDLFGRGYSDRPDTIYNPDFYRKQLNDLLSALHITNTVDFIGVSMGAAIAVDFTDHFPERVRKLCLLDPVGFPVQLPASERLMHVPLLGEYLFTLIGPRSMISFIKKDLVNETPPEYVRAYKEQMRYKGFRHAIISTLRNMPLNNMTDVYMRIGNMDREILLIWGTKDTITPYANNTEARKIMPKARFLPVQGAGHAAHFERPDIVNPALVRFLQQKTSQQK
jgi:pimeloyl-ACP methyl ester carboxylesterase